MASKRNRGTSWEYIVKRKGLLPKPLSLTFHDEAEGDAYVAQLERLLDAGVVPDEFKRRAQAITTISGAVEQFQGEVHITDDDVTLLNSLCVMVGSKSLSSITYAWAEAWVRDLRDSGGAPSTIRKKVGALARCFDWLIRRGDTMLAANPLRVLPKRYSTTSEGRRDIERDRRLLDGEEARILAILDGGKAEGKQRAVVTADNAAWRLLFVLALETAMRMREMYTLTLDQIDLRQRTVFLDKTKNGDNRQVPLSSVAVSAIKDYLTADHFAAAGNMVSLFPFWDGSHDPARLRRTSNRLSHKWAAIFAAAGCDDLHFHDLRHESTSRIYERTTLTDIQISRITGHRNMAMLRRYSNLRGNDLALRMW